MVSKCQASVRKRSHQNPFEELQSGVHANHNAEEFDNDLEKPPYNPRQLPIVIRNMVGPRRGTATREVPSRSLDLRHHQSGLSYPDFRDDQTNTVVSSRTLQNESTHGLF